MMPSDECSHIGISCQSWRHQAQHITEVQSSAGQHKGVGISCEHELIQECMSHLRMALLHSSGNQPDLLHVAIEMRGKKEK